MAAVAALIRSAGGLVVEARVAAGAVSDHPVRLADVEAGLTGCAVGDIASRVGRLGPIQGIRPAGDTGATAQYKKRLTHVLVTRALEEAARRSGEAA
jgi:CO/xanthine dehydrogenase FAD-binding subunit